MRPQFIKAAILSPIIRKENTEIFIHTRQHCDDNTSAAFFRDLDLPMPEYTLSISAGIDKEKIDRMVRKLKLVILYCFFMCKG